MNLKRFNLGAILVTFGIILLSVPEFLLEAKHGIENYGYLGGVLIFIFYAHKAYKRHLFHERDKRWEAKFDAIAKAVGAECGPQRTSRKGDLPNLGRFFLLSRKGLRPLIQRRKRKMNQPINFVTLLAAIASAIKLILQPFGIDIPDEHINSIVNGASAVMVVIGIIKNHFQPKTITPSIRPFQPTNNNPNSYE